MGEGGGGGEVVRSGGGGGRERGMAEAAAAPPSVPPRPAPRRGRTWEPRGARAPSGARLREYPRARQRLRPGMLPVAMVFQQNVPSRARGKGGRRGLGPRGHRAGRALYGPGVGGARESLSGVGTDGGEARQRLPSCSYWPRRVGHLSRPARRRVWL